MLASFDFFANSEVSCFGMENSGFGLGFLDWWREREGEGLDF